jgi:hypothetical protein
MKDRDCHYEGIALFEAGHQSRFNLQRANHAAARLQILARLPQTENPAGQLPSRRQVAFPIQLDLALEPTVRSCQNSSGATLSPEFYCKRDRSSCRYCEGCAQPEQSPAPGHRRDPCRRTTPSRFCSGVPLKTKPPVGYWGSADDLAGGPVSRVFHEPNEPPHVHMDRDDQSCKFWLDPIRLGVCRSESNKFVERCFQPGMIWGNLGA